MTKITFDVLTDEDINETESYFQNKIIISTDNIEQPIINSKEVLSKGIERQLEFNDFLLEALEEALKVLGEPVKNSIFLNLQCNFDIEKEQIPKKIHFFSELLHSIFRHKGAFRLEEKILKNLLTKLNGICSILPFHN